MAKENKTGENNGGTKMEGWELNEAKQEKGYFLSPRYRSEVTGLGFADTRCLNHLSGHFFSLLRSLHCNISYITMCESVTGL